MPVYYRGPCARITHEVMEVWRPTYRTYAIRDLARVWIAERAADPPSVNPLGVGSASMAGAIAVVAAIGWSAGWDAFDSPTARLVTLVLLVASLLVTGACWRARADEQELVAVHQGREMILYQDPDPHRFAQVKRALTRALETVEDTR